ncbi:MAG TPA: hypothetical protein VFK58_03330 [Sphingomicrobium sp.]|nr:hypothetical protein [Sphingomicrobium sp.]
MKRCFVALALAAAACGGPADDGASNADQAQATPAASGSKACDVLTQADAKAVLGRDVEKMESSGGPAALDMCQYGYQGERMMDMGQATVTVQPVDIGSLRQGVLDQGSQAEPVPGLGDEAFWSKDAGLYVGKGNRTAIYLVGVGGEDEAGGKRRAIELAKATVGRL